MLVIDWVHFWGGLKKVNVCLFNSSIDVHIFSFFETFYCKGDPHNPLLPNKKFTNIYRKGEKSTYLRNYNRLSVHDDKIGIVQGFTLCLRIVMSNTNPDFQALKVGFIPLNILSFFCFHIF
jgi:hypothetical protein